MINEPQSSSNIYMGNSLMSERELAMVHYDTRETCRYQAEPSQAIDSSKIHALRTRIIRCLESTESLYECGNMIQLFPPGRHFQKHLADAKSHVLSVTTLGR
jgi:hypothetical protein